MTRHLPAALILPLALLLSGAGAGAAAPGPLCPVPELDAGPDDAVDGVALGRSRDALDRFAACLAEQADVLSLFDPDAALTLQRQRDAALLLRRTLDAWEQATRRAETRPPAL